MLGSIALTLATAVTWGVPVQEPSVAHGVRFVVTAPDGRGALHLAGTFNRWQPADSSWELTREEAAGAALWTITVPVERLGPAPIEFKLTRGSWDTVEMLANGADSPNRIVRASDLENGISLTVEAWADDREGATRESAVTGRLEVFDLASERLGNTRKVRVWLPPGYDDDEHAGRRYPVLYMHDGQNVFDGATSFMGAEWGADESATRLIEAGKITPLIIVGIDHAGAARTAEYNPPFTSKGGVAHYGDRYLDFLTSTLMPEIEKRYRIESGAEYTALGGSSYGGNITLYAGMRHPERFGLLLVESPVFWVFGAELMTRCEQHATWGQRIFLAIGTNESEDERVQAGYHDGLEHLRATFEEQGLLPERARLVVEEGGTHHESSWSRRFPSALKFLFGESVESE